MAFDILAQLHALPDLVIGIVLGFLPLAYTSIIERSGRHQLRVVALFKIRQLAVGHHIRQNRPEGVNGVGAYEIPAVQFHNHVEQGTSPRRVFATLSYHTRFVGDDPLFMTQRWRAYVAQHFDRSMFTLHVVDSDDSRWLQLVPHMAELNVVSVRLIISGRFSKAAVARMARAQLPPGLSMVHIDVHLASADDLNDFEFHPLLYLIRIYSEHSVSPSKVPHLPGNLRWLRLSVTSGLDVSGYCENIPESIEKLELVLDGKPARVSLQALAQFEKLANHNLEVYDGRVLLKKFPGLKVKSKSSEYAVVVDLAATADYSTIPHFPMGLLEVVYSGRKDSPPSLLVIAHWLPGLSRLKVASPVLLEGVVFSSTTNVLVEMKRASPRSDWTVPALGLISTRLSAPVQLFHGLLLSSLQLRVFSAWAPLPRLPCVTKLVLRLHDLKSPDLSLLESVCTLEVRLTYLSAISSSHIPPNVRHVSVHGFRRSTEDPFYLFGESFSFAPLVRIHTLFFDRVFYPIKKLRLPPGLAALRYVGGSQLLREAEFPSMLRTFELDCRLVNGPWVTTDFWGRNEQLVEYPESLRHLLFTLCRVAPPPPGYVLPQALAHLGMVRCQVKDITKFSLPASLVLLDVRGNNFQIPDDYEWPQLGQLQINRPAGFVGFRVAPITDEERELLERRIPGVHINPW